MCEQKTTYEVRGVGYDANNIATDYEILYGEYQTHERAQSRYESVSTLLPQVLFQSVPLDTDSISLRLEKVITHNNHDTECVEILEECTIWR